MKVTDSNGVEYEVSMAELQPTGRKKCKCAKDCTTLTASDFAPGHDARRAGALRNCLASVLADLTDGEMEALAEASARDWLWNGPADWSPFRLRFKVTAQEFLDRL